MIEEAPPRPEGDGAVPRTGFTKGSVALLVLRGDPPQRLPGPPSPAAKLVGSPLVPMVTLLVLRLLEVLQLSARGCCRGCCCCCC